MLILKSSVDVPLWGGYLGQYCSWTTDPDLDVLCKSASSDHNAGGLVNVSHSFAAYFGHKLTPGTAPDSTLLSSMTTVGASLDNYATGNQKNQEGTGRKDPIIHMSEHSSSLVVSLADYSCI